MTKPRRPVDVVDVPCVEAKMQTVAFIRMNGPTPGLLFFTEHYQGKRNSLVVPTGPKFERYLEVRILQFREARQTMRLVQCRSLRCPQRRGKKTGNLEPEKKTGRNHDN